MSSKNVALWWATPKDRFLHSRIRTSTSTSKSKSKRRQVTDEKAKGRETEEEEKKESKTDITVIEEQSQFSGGDRAVTCSPGVRVDMPFLSLVRRLHERTVYDLTYRCVC